MSKWPISDRNLAYITYKSISSALFLTFFPPFWLYSRIFGKLKTSMQQRLGRYPDTLVREISGSPRIWMHAVSVGEVSVAISIMKSLAELMPNCAQILSTGTEQGQVFAREKAGASATCVYAPIDFFPTTRNALSVLNPDILVCVETEIWPNWLIEAHRMGIKTVLVNGRISIRSIRRYLKIRPLMKETLRHVHAFSMIGQADAERIQKLGAPESRIEINGNAKYDLLLYQTGEGLKTAMAKRYNLNGKSPVFVAGSTRGAEVKIILDVYEHLIQSLPETLLIIAPRHVKRAREIEARAKRRGLTCQFRTDFDNENNRRTASVVILDTIGELHATYSIATVVFCGGSLVPRGGQNVLEAAVWGKPVLFGPSMDDFLDAKQLLDKTGGGIQVKDGFELAEKALYYLNNPRQAESVGRLAQQAVFSHKGAARKHAAVIHRLLLKK